MTRFLAIVSLLGLAACQTEPERLCDRVRFGWPGLDLDPSFDVAGDEGIQVDLDLRSDLLEGTVANMFVAGADDELVFGGSAVSGEDGELGFRGITVPEGRALFIVEAIDECGRHRSGRRTFVWDGLGIPICQMSLDKEGVENPEGGPRLLGPEQDQDPSAEGMQVLVRVDAGRPDMEVRIFALDRETGEEQSLFLNTRPDGTVEQELTLGEGEQALRAVCLWEPESLAPTTATFDYIVDLGDDE